MAYKNPEAKKRAFNKPQQESKKKSEPWKRSDGTIDWYLYDMHNTSEDDALDSHSSGSYYGLY